MLASQGVLSTKSKVAPTGGMLAAATDSLTWLMGSLSPFRATKYVVVAKMKVPLHTTQPSHCFYLDLCRCHCHNHVIADPAALCPDVGVARRIARPACLAAVRAAGQPTDATPTLQQVPLSACPSWPVCLSCAPGLLWSSDLV